MDTKETLWQGTTSTLCLMENCFHFPHHLGSSFNLFWTVSMVIARIAISEYRR